MVNTPGVITIDMRPLRRAIRALVGFANKPHVQRLIRHSNDINHIREIADAERLDALMWLDERVQQSYDDLGLERYPQSTTLVEMDVADVIARWRPDAHHASGSPVIGPNPDWTWADAAHNLLTEQRDYQLGLIAKAHQAQSVDGLDPFAPICLGNDGKVWDGHHRICAAMALGIRTVLVDIAP